MAPSGKNQVRYNPKIGLTYITGADGKFVGTMEGDHTKNPLAYDPNASSILNVDEPQTRGTGAANIKQMEKDFVTNMATSAPSLFLPGSGLGATLGRSAASMGLGSFVDQLLNPEKPGAQTLGDVGINTLINEVTAFPFNKEFKFEIPGITKHKAGIVERGSSVYESSNVGRQSGASKGSSIGETLGTNEALTDRLMESTSIRQPYQGEMSTDMKALNDRIAKLKAIEPKNQSQETQVNNLIDKLTEAFDAEAELSSGTITKTTGSSQIKGTGSSKRSSSSYNTGESSGESSGSTKGKTSYGDQITSGNEVTHNAHLLERLFKAFRIKSGNNPLNPLERALLNLGFNTLFDTTANAPKR